MVNELENIDYFHHLEKKEINFATAKLIKFAVIIIIYQSDDLSRKSIGKCIFRNFWGDRP